MIFYREYSMDFIMCVILLIWISFFILHKKLLTLFNKEYEIYILNYHRIIYAFLIFLFMFIFVPEMAIIISTVVFIIPIMVVNIKMWIKIKKEYNNNYNKISNIQKEIIGKFLQPNLKCIHKTIAKFPSEELGVRRHYHTFNFYEYTNKNGITISVKLNNNIKALEPNYKVYELKDKYDILDIYRSEILYEIGTDDSKSIYIITFENKSILISDIEYENIGCNIDNLDKDIFNTIELLRY